MTEQDEAMLDRMQSLAEALDRAEAGTASEDDWHTIRFECHCPKTNRQE
jgi:hypothetical protein